MKNYEAGGKPIDNVTTDRLDIALRMVGITFDHRTIDKIIDIVELIEEKGGETSIQDIEKLKAEWEFSFKTK
jgi:hypothetical protein